MKAIPSEQTEVDKTLFEMSARLRRQRLVVPTSDRGGCDVTYMLFTGLHLCNFSAFAVTYHIIKLLHSFLGSPAVPIFY